MSTTPGRRTPNGISWSISVNPGEKGELFKDGDDGEDKYYIMMLCWDIDDCYVNGSVSAGAEARVLENSEERVTKQFTDDSFTLRLTVQKNGGGMADRHDGIKHRTVSI